MEGSILGFSFLGFRDNTFLQFILFNLFQIGIQFVFLYSLQYWVLPVLLIFLVQVEGLFRFSLLGFMFKALYAFYFSNESLSPIIIKKKKSGSMIYAFSVLQ